MRREISLILMVVSLLLTGCMDRVLADGRDQGVDALSTDELAIMGVPKVRFVECVKRGNFEKLLRKCETQLEAAVRGLEEKGFTILKVRCSGANVGSCPDPIKVGEKSSVEGWIAFIR